MRNRIEHENWILAPIIENDIASLSTHFSGHTDLDHYFLHECLEFEKGLFVKTYKLIDKSSPDIILGLISLCNGSLSFEYPQRKNQIPQEKFGLESYPAVKIERFVISEQFQRLGYGTILLQLLKEFFVFENRTGCRFIIVDSLVGAVPFYSRNDFELIDISSSTPIEELDPDSDTVPMFFNLLK